MPSYYAVNFDCQLNAEQKLGTSRGKGPFYKLVEDLGPKSAVRSG